MIEVDIIGLVDGSPVVTTIETINEKMVTEVFAPLVTQLIDIAEAASGVMPIGIKLSISWADGEEKNTSVGKNQKPPDVFDFSRIPKNWS